MKEFEKYLKTNYPHVRPTSDNAEFARQLWRAALEWVQYRLKFGSDVAYFTDDILMAIKKEIREELED